MADQVVADTTSGKLRGTVQNGIRVFKGIPYGGPAEGAGRFMAPSKPAPWTGVRDALGFGARAMQTDDMFAATPELLKLFSGRELQPMSENCLFLNVWTPATGDGGKRPVMFWCHGGGFTAGSGSSPWYDGTNLCRKGDVVVVTINHRLGAFGYLHLGEVGGQAYPVSGNAGMLDIVEALTWVRDNIAAFGGDPGNVTIFGESGGGAKVSVLLAMPSARGLFAKAIQESGAPGIVRSGAANEKIGSDLLAKLHLPAGAAGLAALRAMPAQSLMAKAEQLLSASDTSGFLWGSASADGYVLTQPSNSLWTSSDQARVPLLIGDITQEFPVDMPDGGKGLIGAVFKASAPEALVLYGFKDGVPPPPDPVLGNSSTQILTDIAIRCSSNREALWQVDAGMSVWRYQFGVARPHVPTVQHNAELDYVFDAPPKNATVGSWPPVQRYWANFLKTGNPNGPGLPEWPAMGHEVNYIAFMPDGIKTGSDLRGPTCRFIADTFAKQ